MQRTSIDRYLIRGELGSGGMGVVWLAYDPRLRREVAIKEVLLPEHLSREARDRTKAWVAREAQATARIDHPSVVTVHDVLEVDDTPFIVMSLIDGGSLRSRLDGTGPLTAEEALSVARTLLDALSAAHRSGVVHRDIKPANIMLTGREPSAVLTDFGIAGVLDSGSVSLTTTGSVLGTAEYLAPERLESKGADPPSDLWSLGATLYTAVSGESPFRRDSLAASLSAVLAGPIPSPPCEGPLGELIEGLLVRDPARRMTAERALDLVGAASDSGGPGAPRRPGEAGSGAGRWSPPSVHCWPWAPALL
ncbi:serine/threonine-protein kinase [Nocardiopsis salina]|uniref:serine/threonine-protein kinase n=1 Tax=Nocardiopsis salina TaxID=245836 RepID=UPI0003491760|nr:serine/threonine-protein kinase [Nocardiopsis salina]